MSSEVGQKTVIIYTYRLESLKHINSFPKDYFYTGLSILSHKHKIKLLLYLE